MKRRMSARMFMILAVPLLLAAVVLSLSQGHVTVPALDLGRAFAGGLGWGPPLPEDQQTTIVSIRLPRILIAVFGGANLAVAGVIMQGVFRNPLASPEILGTAQGSALGATVAIALGWVSMSMYWMPISAVAGALVVLVCLAGPVPGWGGG